MSNAEELAQLRRVISQGVATVENRIATVKTASNDALDEAASVGSAIIRAKLLLGGDFNSWLARNASAVTFERANTLAVLSAAQSEGDMQSGRGKLDALRALGVVE